MKKTRKRSLSERISVFIAKNPAKAVLITILLFNICFVCLSAFIISSLSPDSLENFGFWASVYYTVTMILDAGCIQFVVADIGEASVVVIVICLLIIVVGMITFTGAVIGYLSNYISSFIERSGTGARKLKISNHTIILNWNSRASEIINDMLYCDTAEKIVVMVADGKETIEREISDRLADSMEKEHRALQEACKGKGRLETLCYAYKNRLKNRLTVIVRQGDTFSNKQLSDISLSQAKTVIILGKDIQNGVCQYKFQDQIDKYESGNIDIIKALIQVADITAAEESADNQKIVVEVDDDWTLALVETIIQHKERHGKCNIVPVPVNRVLGQILSQFSIMPELNVVYSELFSNKGAFFASRIAENGCVKANEDAYISKCLAQNNQTIPLTLMDTKEGLQYFYVTASEKAIERKASGKSSEFSVSLNRNFWLERKNIIILGHNSKMSALMSGFNAFRQEWNLADGTELLNIVMIDDAKTLEKNDYFRQYPYVTNVVEADVYDRDLICRAITEFSEAHNEDTSVLILSDDMVPTDEIDSKALTYLVYVQDIIYRKAKTDASFNPLKLDVIVEVLNPKNYDVVRSYSVNNVIISNRYISKMITQISEKEAIFDFYNDILTYDTTGSTVYESKELYIKPVKDFFAEIPPKCTAEELIRAVYHASPIENRSIILGYIRKETDVTFFSGPQGEIVVSLLPDDKLIVFSNH